MKTLAELRTEIELGLSVYPETNHDVAVWREAANPYHEISNKRSDHPWYCLYRDCKLTPAESERDIDREMGGTNIEHAYISFDALLDEWPMLASRPVWNTVKTPERIAYDGAELRAYRARIAQPDAAPTMHNPDVWRDSYDYLRRDIARLYVALDALQSGGTAFISLRHGIDDGHTFELPELFEYVHAHLQSVENMVIPQPSRNNLENNPFE